MNVLKLIVIFLLITPIIIGQEICPPTPECDELDEGQLKPFPPDCTKYIYCGANGTEEISNCPLGTEFDAENEYCADETNCTYCEYIQPTELYCQESQLCSNETIGERFPIPYNCSLYTYCNDYGVGEISFCPDNMHFSPNYLTCEIPSIANCPICINPNDEEATTISICPPITDCQVEDYNKLYPYPPDCTKYIYCDIYGNNQIKSCLDSYHFNPVQLECMPSDQANCHSCSFIH